jgi:hypothetical protein
MTLRDNIFFLLSKNNETIVGQNVMSFSLKKKQKKKNCHVDKVEQELCL